MAANSVTLATAMQAANAPKYHALAPQRMLELEQSQQVINILKDLLPFGANNQQLDAVRTGGAVELRVAAMSAERSKLEAANLAAHIIGTDASPRSEERRNFVNDASSAALAGAGNCRQHAGMTMAA